MRLSCCWIDSAGGTAFGSDAVVLDGDLSLVVICSLPWPGGLKIKYFKHYKELSYIAYPNLVHKKFYLFYRKLTNIHRKRFGDSITLQGAEMTIIKSSVFHVLEKFPDRAGDIKRLYKESQEFQSICEDYRQCAEALHHWNQSNEKEAPTRRQEYEQLFQELMDEIWLCLNNQFKKKEETVQKAYDSQRCAGEHVLDAHRLRQRNLIPDPEKPGASAGRLGA
jgi:hypothetical protein